VQAKRLAQEMASSGLAADAVADSGTDPWLSDRTSALSDNSTGLASSKYNDNQ